MSTVELLVFRHGETDWNRERRLQGHTNTPLNETGMAQARELAQVIEKHRPEVIVTSDLKRAQETANIVNEKLKLPLFMSAELRECMLGQAEGLLHDEIIARFGADSWDRWLSVKEEDKNFGFPGGQKKSEHTKKLMSFLETFLEEHPKYQLAGISTHGGSLRRIVHYAEGSPATPVPLDNCALYRLVYDREKKTWRYLGQIKN